MTKELQDLVWSVLPKEFKEEVKRLHNLQLQKPDKHAWVWSCTYEDLFGSHNLTSDAEVEEMLTVPRKRVQEKWQRAYEQEEKYSRAQDSPVAREELYYNRGIMSVIDTLFGSKCLPDKKGVDIAKLDKMLDETLEKETVDSLNEWMDSREELKSAEPKFKVGQFAMFKGRKVEITGYKKGYLHPYYVHVLTENYGTSVKESDLESYTEPKNEESELLRAESVEESRIADEESHLRNLSQETANCDKSNCNRLNIAAMAMQGILSNAERMKQYGEIAMRESDNLTQLVARNALRYADVLIDKVKKGVNNE